VAVPREPPSAKPGHRTRNRVIVVAVGAVVVLVALFTVPITYSFSDNLGVSNIQGVGFSGVEGSRNATLPLPSGSHVSGTFSESNGPPTLFQILDSNQGAVYSANATSGAFGFKASSPPYTLCAGSEPPGEIVEVSGTYTSPIAFF